MKYLLSPAAFCSALAAAGLIWLSPPKPSQAEEPPAASNPADAANAPALNPPAAANAPAIPPAKSPVALSPGVAEIVRMAQSGVSEQVLLSYVQNSPTAYSLSPDEVIYLRDLGISDAVISAMIDHGKMLRDLVDKANGVPPGQAPSTSPLISTQPSGGPVQPTQPSPPPEANPPPPVTEAPAQVQTAPVIVAPPPVTYNYFYSSLAPYGSWVDVPAYGYCWQPTVVVAEPLWRPYCDAGRWLDTDYGWYWQSDYSWGWAPFHYGRWYADPFYHWLWVPGTYWGPAWVSWRHDGGYCGWAPLPPAAGFAAGVGFTYFGSHVGVSFGFGLGYSDFTFVPLGWFSDPYPGRYFLHGAQVVNIYNKSKVINNYYIQNSNNSFVNGGIPRNEIARLSRHEIRKVNVRELPPAGDPSLRPDRLARDGSQLVVYRPQSRAPLSTPAHSAQELRKALAGAQLPANLTSGFRPPVVRPQVSSRGLATDHLPAAPPVNSIGQTAANSVAARHYVQPIAPGALVESNPRRPLLAVNSTPAPMAASAPRTEFYKSGAPAPTHSAPPPWLNQPSLIHTPTQPRRDLATVEPPARSINEPTGAILQRGVSSSLPARSATEFAPATKPFEQRSGPILTRPAPMQRPRANTEPAGVASGASRDRLSFYSRTPRVTEFSIPQNSTTPRLELSKPYSPPLVNAPPQTGPQVRTFELPARSAPSIQFRPEYSPRSVQEMRPSYSAPATRSLPSYNYAPRQVPSQTYTPFYSTRSYSAPSYSRPSYSAPSYSARSYTPSYSRPSYSAPSYSRPSYSSGSSSRNSTSFGSITRRGSSSR